MASEDKHDQDAVESEDHLRGDVPPPAYESDACFRVEEMPGLYDGRVDIDLDTKFARTLSRLLRDHPTDEPATLDPSVHSDSDSTWSIPLNIVIQVVGSRGDVQPFVALGAELQKYGHRVRLATHGVFEKFVRDASLEFFDIGGDPEALMAYMVKNPGLIPGMKTLREGEIQRKRAMIAEMLDGCWRSCISPDARSSASFVAEAIIANPVSFAHVHCAQALSIPIHLMFTMPWTGTRAFPHPLANIKDSKHEPRLANYLSYGMVECMTWQGLGDVINTWRDSIDLPAIPLSEGPFLAATLKIPHTYCWSAALIPKPADWAGHINVCGFFFREMPAHVPSPALAEFLAAGPPPVYIGFGSIVIDNPPQLTSVLLEAIALGGFRAIISRGWSKIGGPSASKNVFYLDDCPHEWLFQKVSAVVHHGGAGTTACGLLNARPTVVVPFFGDQPFWGQMIANAEAGPQPIPYKLLTSQRLVEAIAYCFTPKAVEAAGRMASQMSGENGVQQAVALFHSQLPRERMGCEILPHQCAKWLYQRNRTAIRLSSLAVEKLSLAQGLKFKRKHLQSYGPSPFIVVHRRWDPFTSMASASVGFGTDLATSAVGMFAEPTKVFLNRNNESMVGDSANVGGKAARAFAKPAQQLTLGSIKSGLVDVPLALAEGFRNTPRLWGQTVEAQQEITGWSSGAAVAGKSLAWGWYDGVGGFFYKPYKGAKEEGALGFAKGIGKGLAGIVLEPVSGSFGVFGYTGDGISKSLSRAVHRKTIKSVKAAKRAEGNDLVQRGEIATTADDDVVQHFLRLGGK